MPIATDGNQRPKHLQRRVMGLVDFTGADIAAIEASDAPPEAAGFDGECEVRT